MTDCLVASPCVDVCVVDDAGVCQGCFRTLAEITAWRGATDREKANILLKAKTRQEALFDSTPGLAAGLAN